MVKARRGRPILFVDLAVPRDVDPALAAFDGCFVYDIDDLEAVVEASLAGRRAEAVRAERVVTGEAERFREWQASLAVVPAITSLRALAEEIRTHELERAQGRLGRLTETRPAPRRVGDGADREQAPARADDPHEGGRRDRRWGGLC